MSTSLWNSLTKYRRVTARVCNTTMTFTVQMWPRWHFFLSRMESWMRSVTWATLTWFAFWYQQRATTTTTMATITLIMSTRCHRERCATTMSRCKRTITLPNRWPFFLTKSLAFWRTFPRMTSKCSASEWWEWSWALIWQSTCKTWHNSRTDARPKV